MEVHVMQLPDTSSLETLHKEWPVIKAAPYSFFASLGILLFIGWGVIWWVNRSLMQRRKETIDHLERDVVRLKTVSTTNASTEDNRKPDAFKSPKWEIVDGYSFTNQIVELDGKSFRNCSFTNVTLTYNGKAPTEILTGCVLGPSIVLDTRNPALIEYWRLQKFIRSFPGAQVHREGPADAKGNLMPDKFSFQALPPENPLVLDLCSRALILGKALQEFLKLHGPEPKVTRQLSETVDAFQERWRAEVMPWRPKFFGDYRTTFGRSVPSIRDEIKARHGIHDGT